MVKSFSKIPALLYALAYLPLASCLRFSLISFVFLRLLDLHVYSSWHYLEQYIIPARGKPVPCIMAQHEQAGKDGKAIVIIIVYFQRLQTDNKPLRAAGYNNADDRASRANRHLRIV